MNLIVSDEAKKRRSIEDSAAFARESADEQIIEATMKLCACGRMFTPYRSYQRYCSDKCRIKYTSARASTYVKKPVKRQACKNCGEVFETNDAKRHYCSDACYHQFQLKRRSPKEQRTCFTCGKTFETTHWAKRYCSEECRRRSNEVS